MPRLDLHEHQLTNSNNRAKADSVDLLYLLLVGVVYVSCIVFREVILALVFEHPANPSRGYLHRSGTSYTLALAVLYLPALVILLALVKNSGPKSIIRCSIDRATTPVILATMVLTFIGSVVLNAINAWPFAWRWASDSTASYVQIMLGDGNFIAFSIWAVTIILVAPIIEEFVFRVGILQAVARQTGSLTTGVVVSAVLFGLGHIGYWPLWGADRQHLVNSGWLLVTSLLLGYITVKRGGIALPLAIHSGRNAIELMFLIVALNSM